ncbi:hypothetical protein SLEP1_g3073 [Rubroshorea leprosula]|uniref:GRF-type domain-containing protein n=1 Tax=Rubroshorea leprosula TaxID=152421 RepID=A0AAV5HQM6_9ROSI|nr:hypothetical protein SLEP1_g3073 [Rubroshorea leprosula]
METVRHGKGEDQCYDQDQEEVEGSHYAKREEKAEAEAEVKAKLNGRSKGVGGGAGEAEQNILEVLDFWPETKMKSRASSSTSTSSLRASVDRSSARQVCDHGLAAWLHVSTSELNPGRRYYKCPFWLPSGGGARACIFFEWVDAELSSWYKDVFNRLENENLALENENKMLRAELVSEESSGGVEMEAMVSKREKDERCICGMDNKEGMPEKIEENGRIDSFSLNFYRTAFFCCVVFIACLVLLK